MSLHKISEGLDLHAKGLWFPVTVGVVLLAIVLLMPKKKISWSRIVFIYGVIGYMTWMIDTSVYGVIDVFDIGKQRITGLGDIIIFGIIPSSLSVIFLNYCKMDKKWWYVALFTVISFLFEWTLVQVGYMKLKGWHTWWSIPFYLIMFGFIVPWLFKLLKQAGSEDERQKEPREIFIGKKEKAR